MSDETNYFLGQGKLYLAQRLPGGKIGTLRWLGDVSSLELSLKTQTVDHVESHSGKRMTAKKIVVGNEATVEFTMMELSRGNLELGLYGQSNTIPAGTITDEPLDLPNPPEPNFRFALKHMKLDNVVLMDSATPPMIIDESKYEVDPVFGAITFKDPLSGMTWPLKVGYGHAEMHGTAIYGSSQAEVFLRYEGINLAEGNQPILLELYKVQTEPLKKLALITTKMAEYQISSTVLIDTTLPAGGELGQFGRYVTA